MAMQNNIIDQVFPETLKILSDLIKFQTVSGTSNLKLIEYCEKKLSKLGATSFKTFHDSKQQANLFSTINGKRIRWRRHYIVWSHRCCSCFC